MAERKDTQAADIAAEAATPATDKSAASEASSSAETPRSEPETPAAEAEAPAVKGGALIIAVKAPHFSSSDAFASDDAEPEVTEATIISSSRWRLPSYAPLAAGIVLAVAIGAIAGAAALSTLRPDTSAATAAAVDKTHTLQATVTQLNSELAALKTALSNAQRTAATQLGKLTERL